MPNPFPNKVKEACWALHCDGYQGKEISRMLAAGEAGLPKRYEPSVHTVHEWLGIFRKERGPAYNDIPPGAELAQISSMERMVLKTAKTELQKEIDADVFDELRVKRLMDLIDKTKQTIQRTAPDPTASANASQAASHGPTRDLMDEIAQEMKAEAKRLGSDGSAASGGDAIPELQEAAKPDQL